MVEYLITSLPIIGRLEMDQEKIHHLETHIWKETQDTGQVEKVSKFFDLAHLMTGTTNDFLKGTPQYKYRQ